MQDATSDQGPAPAPPGIVPHAGLYIHIPFCLKKCPYCDFFSVTDLSLIPRFVAGLMTEMRLRAPDALPFDTLYIGGGTPSVLDADQVAKIVREVHAVFEIRPGAEITLEVNPGTRGALDLKAFRQAGINRVNIGVQSFQDRHLNFLGRVHTGQQARLAVESARSAGFKKVGLDLIYAIPGQSKKSWVADLTQAVDLGPEHLSCYMLTLEPKTPMARALHAGRFHAMPDQAVAGLFTTTQSVLRSRGFSQYEISNFADSRGAMSRHNRKYWSFTPYDGLGPAAHTFRDPVRWWNHRSVGKYLADVGAGRTPVAGKEVLGREQQIIETVYLGLRTADGIRIPSFNLRFKTDFHSRFFEPITALESEGILEVTPNRCALTTKGMRFHEGIARMFIDYI